MKRNQYQNLSVRNQCQNLILFLFEINAKTFLFEINVKGSLYACSKICVEHIESTPHRLQNQINVKISFVFLLEINDRILFEINVNG